MSISVADNFQYKGGKPLDARMKFATILDMTAAQVADLYDGCFSYVVAEKKYYSYDSNNENDPHLGKWREYSAGAEYSDFTGATSQDAGAHGLVPAPTTADVDKYLKGDGSWGAISMPNFDYSNEFGAENIYDTQEKMIGQWTDGKPLYQKTITGSWNISNTWNSIATIQNIENIIKAIGFTSEDHSFFSFGEGEVRSEYAVYLFSSLVRTIDKVTLQYTKTTDSAMSIGTPNDYSTTEKIVGTWIDGKPIYQKVFEVNISLPAQAGEMAYFDASGLENIDTLVSSKQLSYDPSYKASQEFHCRCDYIRNSSYPNGRIRLSVNPSDIGGNLSYLVLRYTKTT